jgi:hypothetical protein
MRTFALASYGCEEARKTIPMRVAQCAVAVLRWLAGTRNGDLPLYTGHFRIEEEMPWGCRRLVVGTGTGALPLMEEVKREAHRRQIIMLILLTVEAIGELKQHRGDTSAILHVTC